MPAIAWWRREERPRVDAYAARLYTPVAARLGFTAKQGESASDRRLRNRVLGLLQHTGEPGVTAQLAKLGRAYAGLDDGKLHAEAVSPDLAGLALYAAVQAGDAALFDALESRLGALDDAQLRERIVGALGGVRDPERSARALALSLDPRLRKQEVLTSIWGQAVDERTRPAAWAFVQAHFDELVARTPETYGPGLAYIPSGFCDAGRAPEMRAFFEPRIAKVNGMKKTLRESLERLAALRGRGGGPAGERARLLRRALRDEPRAGEAGQERQGGQEGARVDGSRSGARLAQRALDGSLSRSGFTRRRTASRPAACRARCAPAARRGCRSRSPRRR